LAVALFRSDSAPLAPSFHVLQGIYLSIHPAILERLSAPEELLFRKDSSGMCESSSTEPAASVRAAKT
jgi:hypothetical protein